VELKDTYLTIARDSAGFYKEKGSKFLAFAYPVSDEESVRTRIADLKKKYYDARHYCYAYIMGFEGDNYRANDDGEPGHSAGDPILGQIRSNELTDTLIVVVRYFGGTKLGVGGLIHAYKTAAADAIQNNQIVEKLIFKELRIKFEYPQMNVVMKLVKDHGLQIIDQKLEMSCEMMLGVRLSMERQVVDIINDIQGLTILAD
jgi:uncharacterized YigZ family protein